MKIVEPSFEILDGLDRSPIAVRLEACGRICYKSEEKISEDSAIPFIKRIGLHGHNSVLEMAVSTFRVTCHPDEVLGIFAIQPKYLIVDKTDTGALITGSVRAFRELHYDDNRDPVLCELVRVLLQREPYLGEGIFDWSQLGPLSGTIKVEKLSLRQVDALPAQLFCRHRFTGVRFIVNRAFTHELVRHRPCSYLQESQRYCRYSQDKFDNQVTFIKPLFYQENSVEYELWKEAMALTEKLYLRLLESSSPQAARTVLPNSCKTEIIAYCNLQEWKHIFSLRTSEAAEPSMREIMIPLQKEMAGKFPFLHNNC